MSWFVRSSATTLLTEISAGSEGPGTAPATGGAPGGVGTVTPPSIWRFCRGRPPAAAGTWVKIWFTLSATSRAGAYRTGITRMRSLDPGRSSASRSFSMRRTLSARSVTSRTSGWTVWMSAPWGDVKLPSTARSWSGSRKRSRKSRVTGCSTAA